MPRAKVFTGPVVEEKITPKSKVDIFRELTWETVKPYREGEELPPPVLETVLDEKNNTTIRVLRIGEPRVFMKRTPNGRINVLAKYREANKTTQENLTTLKPRDTARMIGMPIQLIQKAERDNKIFKTLQDRNIPLIQEYTPV